MVAVVVNGFRSAILSCMLDPARSMKGGFEVVTFDEVTDCATAVAIRAIEARMLAVRRIMVAEVTEPRCQPRLWDVR